MKYVKRPIIIEAFRYPMETFPHWAKEAVINNTIVVWEGFLTIETLEGTMRADPGDYLIKGIENEIYPCKANIFEQLYDKYQP